MSDTHVSHGHHTRAALANLFILTHDCSGSLIIFRVVLLSFVTIDRLFLCSLVQVESNMQYGQRWESDLHDACELQCLAMAFTIMRLQTARMSCSCRQTIDTTQI